MATERNEILQMREGKKRRLLGKGNASMKPVSNGVKRLHSILGAESPAQLTKVHIYQGRREAESFFLYLIFNHYMSLCVNRMET